MKKILHFLKNVIPFQKETLQEHTNSLFVFCRLVWIPKPNPIIFIYNFLRSRRKRHNMENLDFSTTLQSFEELS